MERFGELIHNHAWAIQCDRPPYLITMNMASRLALLHSIGMFDERWLRMQDCDIAYRLVAAGERLAYQDDAVIYHHNRDTLAGLAREGFRHGYYLPAFLGVHGTFMRDYQQRMAGTPVPPPVRRPLPELEPWRQRLYWRVFRTAKSAGIWKGRLFPPPIR